MNGSKKIMLFLHKTALFLSGKFFRYFIYLPALFVFLILLLVIAYYTFYMVLMPLFVFVVDRVSHLIP